MNANSQLYSLRRYYIWSDSMKSLFVQELEVTSLGVSSNYNLKFMYMSYWFASTYVLVEGWNRCKLTDPIIDQLLKSHNVRLLCDYRNSVFHFQTTENDVKTLTSLLTAGQQAVEWMLLLNQAFSNYFSTRTEEFKELLDMEQIRDKPFSRE